MKNNNVDALANGIMKLLNTDENELKNGDVFKTKDAFSIDRTLGGCFLSECVHTLFPHGWGLPLKCV